MLMMLGIHAASWQAKLNSSTMRRRWNNVVWFSGGQRWKAHLRQAISPAKFRWIGPAPNRSAAVTLKIRLVVSPSGADKP